MHLTISITVKEQQATENNQKKAKAKYKWFPLETRMHHHELSCENIVTHQIQLLTQTKAGFFNFWKYNWICLVSSGSVMPQLGIELHYTLHIQGKFLYIFYDLYTAVSLTNVNFKDIYSLPVFY